MVGAAWCALASCGDAIIDVGTCAPAALTPPPSPAAAPSPSSSASLEVRSAVSTPLDVALVFLPSSARGLRGAFFRPCGLIPAGVIASLLVACCHPRAPTCCSRCHQGVNGPASRSPPSLARRSLPGALHTAVHPPPLAAGARRAAALVAAVVPFLVEASCPLPRLDFLMPGEKPGTRWSRGASPWARRSCARCLRAQLSARTRRPRWPTRCSFQLTGSDQPRPGPIQRTVSRADTWNYYPGCPGPSHLPRSGQEVLPARVPPSWCAAPTQSGGLRDGRGVAGHRRHSGLATSRWSLICGPQIDVAIYRRRPSIRLNPGQCGGPPPPWSRTKVGEIYRTRDLRRGCMAPPHRPALYRSRSPHRPPAGAWCRWQLPSWSGAGPT